MDKQTVPAEQFEEMLENDEFLLEIVRAGYDRGRRIGQKGLLEMALEEEMRRKRMQ